MKRLLKTFFILVGCSIALIGFAFFTSLGREWVLCRIYNYTQYELLKRPGMKEQLAQQWKILNVGSVVANKEWLFVPISGGHVPIPAGQWKIVAASTSVVSLVATSRQAYEAVILSGRETFNSWGDRLLQTDLHDEYDLTLALYRQDFSMPCHSKKSTKALGQDYFLMILKSLSTPSNNRHLYFYPEGHFIANLVPASVRSAWICTMTYRSSGRALTITYLIRDELAVSPLLEQWTIMNKNPEGMLPPPSLSDLPALLTRLESNGRPSIN